MASKKSRPAKPTPVAAIVEKNDFSYWLIGGLLVIFLIYLPSLFNGITNWDDPEYIHNPFVTNLSLSGIVKIFSVYFAGNYHPLTLLSLGLDQLIGGDRPFMFHLTNLLLHIFNSLLVYILVKRLTQNHILALLTFMMFGIHSLHVESVAWISERKDVLYSFFYLLSLIIYTNYTSGHKKSGIIISLLFFLLSLLAKGQAVTLVVLLPFIDYLQGRKWFSTKVLLEKVPFLLLSLVFTWFAFRAQESAHAIHLNNFSLPERFAFASFGLTQYLIKSIFPVSLSALYPFPVKPPDGNIPSYYWLFMMLLPLYATGTYFLFKYSKILLFGISMFFLTLLPLLQLIPVGQAIMADRYFYIPSVGLLLCFAFAFMEIKHARIRYTLFFLFIAVLSGLTFLRCMVWKDSLTLWNDVIRKYDGSAVALCERGIAYRDLKQLDKSMADFSSAIRIDPNYFIAYYNRGLGYWNLGQWDKAISDYSRMIEADPQNPEVYFNRGLAYFSLGQPEKSITDYSQAISLDPEYSDAYSNRGLALGNLGRWENAIDDYSRAIIIDPHNADAFYNRAIAYTNTAQPDKSIYDFSSAIDIAPKYVEAYLNRGITFISLGQWENAINDFSKVIAIDPKNTKAYSSRGIAYGYLGQINMSIDDYTRAIEIDPGYAEAYFDRGVAYGNLKQWNKAIDDYLKTISIDNKNMKAFSNLGNVFGALGQFDKAIGYFTVAISIDPKYTNAYFNRGAAYLNLGKLNQAINDFSEAIEIDPQLAPAYYYRGVAKDKTGNNTGACNDMKKAGELKFTQADDFIEHHCK